MRILIYYNKKENKFSVDEEVVKERIIENSYSSNNIIFVNQHILLYPCTIKVISIIPFEIHMEKQFSSETFYNKKKGYSYVKVIINQMEKKIVLRSDNDEEEIDVEELTWFRNSASIWNDPTLSFSGTEITGQVALYQNDNQREYHPYFGSKTIVMGFVPEAEYRTCIETIQFQTSNYKKLPEFDFKRRMIVLGKEKEEPMKECKIKMKRKGRRNPMDWSSSFCSSSDESEILECNVISENVELRMKLKIKSNGFLEVDDLVINPQRGVQYENAEFYQVCFGLITFGKEEPGKKEMVEGIEEPQINVESKALKKSGELIKDF